MERIGWMSNFIWDLGQESLMQKLHNLCRALYAYLYASYRNDGSFFKKR